jgi:hypothetical protein
MVKNRRKISFSVVTLFCFFAGVFRRYLLRLQRFCARRSSRKDQKKIPLGILERHWGVKRFFYSKK